MTDINKAIRDVLEEMSNGDGYLCTLGIHADPVIAKIKALVVESLGEDDIYNEMCEHCNNWDEGRNDLRGEIRSIWG